MNELHKAFRMGAEVLAKGQYSDYHRAHGILESDWSLLTQKEHWTPEESRMIRSILASVMEVCLTIAGMPAVPLPGQYAAATIAIIVAPANRFVACLKVPATFDAAAASGLMETVEIKEMKPEQIIALMMAYSGGLGGEPQMEALPEEVKEYAKKESTK
jgi:hypothetical protein